MLAPKLPTSIFKHRDPFVRTFDDVFDQLIKSSFPELSKSLGVDPFTKGSYPKLNVVTNDIGLRVTAEIPGLTKDEVTITFKEGVLTISGDKRESETSDSEIYIIRELKHSSFKRSLIINSPVKESEISAKFENGILTITIPFMEEQKSTETFIPIH